MLNKSIFLTLITLLVVSCGPARVPPYKEIATNETAFLVPLEGDTKKQSQFMSVGFLEKAKVAAKRVTFPIRKRSTGRMWYDYQWIPTMKLIKVSRAPVTREWTDSGDTGTTTRNEALNVESLDSIGFAVGVNLTAMIEETDAALFLNKYAGKSLADVVDTDVRGYVLSVAADEFGSRLLQKCKEEKGTIFTKIRSRTTEHFKNFGVTISNLGHSEGLTYLNANIQKAIDDAYVQEMDIEKAKQEQAAAEIRNTTAEEKVLSENKRAESVVISKNKRKEHAARSKTRVAREFLKNSTAKRELLDWGIRNKNADALLRWNGSVPSGVVPSDSPFLFNISKK